MRAVTRSLVILITMLLLLAGGPAVVIAGEVSPVPTRTPIPDDDDDIFDDDDDADDDGCQVGAVGPISPWSGLLPLLAASGLSRARRRRRSDR